MPININFTEITPLLSEKTLILTPNSRTQKALISGFIEPLSLGDVVRAPHIISLSQWLDYLWQELSFIEVLPNLIGDLELKVWLKELILKEDHWQLTNALGVAEKVLEAYRNLSLWGKKISDVDSLDTPENQYFVLWITQLENFCSEKNLIPHFYMLAYLSQRMAKLTQFFSPSHLPQQILLVGFNQFSPMEENFFDICKNLGIDTKIIQQKSVKNKISRVEVIDFKQELEVAAANALGFFKNKPEKSLGIVVQQLSNNIPMIHQVFSEYFQPQESLPWNPVEKTLYNVSAGQPLANLVMIDSAIKLLQLRTSGFELKTLYFFKNTPFIDWGEHEGVIKRFIHQQSLLSYANYSISYLLAAIEKEPQPALLERLGNRLYHLKELENYARPMSAWVDFWKNFLKSWGWLENKSLIDAELQLEEAFYLSMKESLNISLIYQKLSSEQAKDYFFQVLRQKVFQVPSDRTNIHILGVLEAAGLEFDEIIMVGFNRDNWPQKNKINPFLPIKFQQDNNMPGSSAEREYLYAKSLSDSLLAGSEKTLITQSQTEDGISAESPLFSGFPLLDLKLDSLLFKKTEIKPDYLWLKDENINVDKGKIKGGAYLLSLYASCPFKAMSSFQFKLRAAQKPQKGIEPKIRGAWVHLAMELLWLELKTQKILLSLNENEISQLVERCVLKAKEDFETPLSISCAVEVIEIETQKIQQQIIDWLVLDKNRDAFEVSTEVEKTLVIRELEFKFRIDRIDRNSSGGLEIIDYKTGNVDIKKWLGQRPEEAQMPAYVLACEDQAIHSLSYAKIKTGEICRSGVWFDAKDKSKFKFIEENAEGKKDKTKYLLLNPNLVEKDKSLTEQWRESLENLTDKIFLGDMPVSPKNSIESCRYCDFSDFCRVAEPQPKSPDIEIASNNEPNQAAPF